MKRPELHDCITLPVNRLFRGNRGQKGRGAKRGEKGGGRGREEERWDSLSLSSFPAA